MSEAKYDATPREIELLRELEDACRFHLDRKGRPFPDDWKEWQRVPMEVVFDLDAERAERDIPAGATPLDPALEQRYGVSFAVSPELSESWGLLEDLETLRAEGMQPVLARLLDEIDREMCGEEG